MAEKRKRKKAGDLIEEVKSLGNEYYSAVDELAANEDQVGVQLDEISIANKYSPKWYEIGEETRPRITGDLIHDAITLESLGKAITPPSDLYSGVAYEGFKPTDLEKSSEILSQLDELGARARMARSGSPVVGAPGFRLRSQKDESDLAGFNQDYARTRADLEGFLAGQSEENAQSVMAMPSLDGQSFRLPAQRGVRLSPMEQTQELLNQLDELRARARIARRGSPVAGAPGFRLRSAKDESDLAAFKEDYADRLDALEEELSYVSDPEAQSLEYGPSMYGQSLREPAKRGERLSPQEQTQELLDQINELERRARIARSGTGYKSGFKVRTQKDRDDLAAFRKDIRRLRSTLNKELGSTMETDMQGSTMEVDMQGSTKVDPNSIEYDGMSMETGDIDGMSYGMSIEEDALEKQFPGDKRKPVAPKRIAANPEAMIKQSQEQGVPWQDLLVDAYVADNPWIDRTKIKAAVYNVASRHFDNYTKSGGNPSNYMSRLSRDLRGGRSSGKGKSKSRRGRYSNFFTESMKEKAEVLRTARNNQLKFIKEQREKLNESVPAAVGEDGVVTNQRQLNDAFKNAQEQSYDIRNGEVEAMYRSLPQSQVDRDNAPKVGYFGLQKILIDDIQKELARRVKENDREALDLVGKYTPKGKKPSKASFLAAAEEIYNDAGLYDSVRDQGLRGIQKKARRKRSRKKSSQSFNADGLN